MITTRIAAAFAAGALAVGMLAGSAGTIVLRDATASQTVDWTAQMTQAGSMMSMMGGSGGMMGGSGGMMGGSGGMMGGSGGTGPAAPAMQNWMQQHHVTGAPVPTR
jgi:hypothetical protein